MKIRTSLAMAMVMAALCVAGCDEPGQDSAASSTSIEVLGPTPLPSQNMIVRRAFTTVSNNGVYDIGARGWSAPGPLVDFQVENPAKDPMILDSNPQVVVVSGLHNVSHVTVAQPATTSIPGGGSTSFAIEFMVDAKGDFEFGVSISNHGPFSADFSFVVSGKGQEQLGYTKAISGLTDRGVFINGAAADNPEQQHTSGNNAKHTEFSPNGRFCVANINSQAVVISTATGNAVTVMAIGPYNQFTGAQFSWQNGPNDTQLLALLSKRSDGEARQLHTCVVGGANSPQVSNLAEVSLMNAPAYDYALARPTWSHDGGRLAFHVTRIPYWDSQSTGSLWACLFNNGQPGQARELASFGGYSNFENSIFDWADAQGANDTLVYQNWQTQTPVRSISVSTWGSLLVAGAPVQITTQSWGWLLSPNRTRILMVRRLYNGNLVSLPCVYSFSTPGAGQVSAFPTQPSHPFFMQTMRIEWAPDSMSFAFTGVFSRQDTNDLYRQRLTTATGPAAMGGAPVNLTNFQDTTEHLYSFKWSPESQRIAFEVVTYAYSPGDPVHPVHHWVRMADIGTGEITQVSFRRTLMEYFYLYDEFRFSPRGDALAWVMRPPEDGFNLKLMIVPLSGSRWTMAGDVFEASGAINGFGVEKYQWLR
ncbi:MAG: hypothetical protein IT462_06060 [Planctomycetes bacterium]|nr:hypothetical protein [Planctomycetota bacterium]